MTLFSPDTKTNGQFSHLIGENITPTSFLASVIQDDHFFFNYMFNFQSYQTSCRHNTKLDISHQSKTQMKRTNNKISENSVREG